MKKVVFLLTLLMVASSTTTTFAQKGEGDGPVGIFPSGAEYDQFMRGAKEAAYGEGGSAELQSMIPMLNDIALNKPMGWTAQEYGASNSTLGLLSDDSIRDDIEMVDEQYKELQDRSAEIQKLAAQQLRNLDFDDRENLVSRINKIRQQATGELNSVLLPHQIERLKQIRMQSQLQRRSLVDVLTSDPVKTELEITDKQSDELREEEKEIQADLEKEIARLREEARKRLLSKLKPTQKSEVEKMFGETFAFKSRENKKDRRKKGKAKKAEKGF